MVVVQISSGSGSSEMRVVDRSGCAGRLVVQKAMGSSLSGVVMVCGRTSTMGGCGESVQKRRESSSSSGEVVTVVVSGVVVGTVWGLASRMGRWGESVQISMGTSEVVSEVVQVSSGVVSVLVGGKGVKKLSPEVMDSVVRGRGDCVGVVGSWVVYVVSSNVLGVVFLLSGFGWNISGLGAKVDLSGVVAGVASVVVNTDRLKFVSARKSMGLGVTG